MITFKQFVENQDKMSAINTQQALQGKPQQWIQALTKLPSILQKEILVLNFRKLTQNYLPTKICKLLF
jgi:hypothetical protein